MRWLLLVLCAGYGNCRLWPQGIVHYAINTKDYDLHSQDEIMETFARLQKELCVKFFNTPTNFTATAENKILYISNPDKKKDCPPIGYDFSKSVVDMPIGYRCINQKDIARITVDMLKASVIQNVSIYNSYDLVKRFHEMEDSVPRSALLPPTDRNYLNAHYHTECGSLGQASARRINEVPASAQLTDANIEYYKDKLWPLGVVMYGVDKDIPSNDSNLLRIKQAMSVIELNTCVMFQGISSEGVLEPRNFLWLSYQGEDMPQLGFKQGNQSLNIASLAQGAPGHAAHALVILLRALGVPMMSNRRDRDNHVAVDWRNVAHGKEHYLEKSPDEAWLQQIPYDFGSATHAPANYMCRDCDDPLASRTVIPLQDHLWQRTLSMGRRFALSDSDIQLLGILYAQQCRERFMQGSK